MCTDTLLYFLENNDSTILCGTCIIISNHDLLPVLSCYAFKLSLAY